MIQLLKISTLKIKQAIRNIQYMGFALSCTKKKKKRNIQYKDLIQSYIKYLLLYNLHFDPPQTILTHDGNELIYIQS